MGNKAFLHHALPIQGIFRARDPGFQIERTNVVFYLFARDAHGEIAHGQIALAIGAGKAGFQRLLGL